MFGLTIVRKSYLEDLEKRGRIVDRLSLVHRWFAGWRDLDIIWDYLYMKDGWYSGTIDSVRVKYAEARGTNEYGKRTDKAPGGGQDEPR